MIILSQDKEGLINMKQLQDINVISEHDDDTTCTLRGNFIDCYDTLGCYSSKERAKQVLLDIAKHISLDTKIYEMPEE